MRILHALSQSGQGSRRRHPVEKKGRAKRVSEDGLAVTEAEFWEKYYNDPDFVYEWKNGHLEEKPMSDQKGSETYQWFYRILSCYIETHPVGRISNLEIGFRMELSDETDIRRPDVAVVLNDNPTVIDDDDCTYKGIFDLCVESLSHSSKKEVDRDTVHKKREYREAGVWEYYILDARKTETVFYRLNARGHYRKISGDIIRSKVLPGFQFRVSDLYRKPPLEELAEDPIYRDYVFPSFREVKRKLAFEKERAEKEKKRAEKAEKLLASEKQRIEKQKRLAEKLKQRAREVEKRLASERQRAEREKSETARSMMADGLPPAVIMKYTGLSAHEIAALL